MPKTRSTTHRFFGLRAYSVLLQLMLPFVLFYLWWHGRKNPAYRQRFKERFGRQIVPHKWRGAVHFHCVSVGEFMAARPLIDRFVADDGGRPVVITCMTPTASELISKTYGDKVYHCYIPFDTYPAVQRFLSAIQPSAVVILETELWPNLVLEARAQDIPVAMVNGRMSAQSARGYQRLEWLFKPAWEALSYCAAQTEVAAERFQLIGVPERVIDVAGNLKFDVVVSSAMEKDIASYRELLADRPIVTAGSTHANEEAQLLTAFGKILKVKPHALLILVPRHQERFAEVAALVEAQGLRMIRRSSGRPVTPDTQVLLGDSMGELLLWYGIADITFIGGSLIERGGHNPLEAIAFGKPLVSGRHVFNFQEVYNQLDKRQAVRWVNDADGLADTLIGLLTTTDTAARIGQDAQRIFAEHRGATQRLQVRIQQLIAAS